MRSTLILIIFLYSCVWSQSSNSGDVIIPDTLIVGNFDSDRVPDTAQLWVPLGHNNMFGCMICNTEIRFSNGIKTISHTDDIGYRLENIGDINGDKIDEIAYCTDWYMGCRRTYEIYIITANAWLKIIGMEFIACQDNIGLKKRIQAIDKNTLKLWGHDVKGLPIFKIVKLN